MISTPPFRPDTKIISSEQIGKILFGSKTKTLANEPTKGVTACQWANAAVGLGESDRYTTSKKRAQKIRGITASEQVDDR